MKSVYVRALRALRTVLGAVGLLGLLDRLAPRSRTALWVRSWFSVYDLHDLARLDVPWWTFEASDRVAAFLRTRPDARALEWGSGASTLWLARRCGSVTSIEHDPVWARDVGALLPGNVELRLVEPTCVVAPAPGVVLSHKDGFEGLDFAAYVAEADVVGGAFDVVVIDGRAREACLGPALAHLAPGGVVVFDNVDRERYRDAMTAALAGRADLDVVWTRGRTPALPYPTRTALIGSSRP